MVGPGSSYWQDRERTTLLRLMASGNGEPERETAPAAGGRSGVRAATRRILIIEDNVDAAQTLGDLLELNGHEIQIAYTGPEGVEAAAQFYPEIVLCDIGLPGMSGWEVARILREMPATSTGRLIAISGYGAAEDRRQSADAGFEAHLTKPVDVDALEILLTRDA
jgi:CheY-like chemotaxis protein